MAACKGDLSMSRIMGPKVTITQGPEVTALRSTLRGMDDPDAIRAAFAHRMGIVCDELNISRGHGRQTALGDRFHVTAKAARKWLLGMSYPEMPTALIICQAANVNVNWLLQGVPPMRGDRVDPRTYALANAVESLPDEKRRAVLDHLRYQFERSEGWFAAEEIKRYLHQLDQLDKRASEPSGGGASGKLRYAGG